MNSVASLKSIAVVKVAVLELCDDPSFIMKLLHVTRPDYEQYTNSWKIENEQLWDDMMKRKYESIKSELDLPFSVVVEVFKWIQPISREILRWCRYHKDNFQLPHNYNVQFLTPSLFTSEGRVNVMKAAMNLVRDDELSVLQRYKMACHYLLIANIRSLWNKMTDQQKQVCFIDKFVQRGYQSPLGRIWASRFLHRGGEFLRVTGCSSYTSDEVGFWRFIFDHSVIDGNKVATKHSWEKLQLTGNLKITCVVKAGVRLLKQIKERCPSEIYGGPVCIRSHIEILCFLLSQMNLSVRRRFLTERFDLTASKLLKYLIDWHHEDIFMNTVHYFWAILTPQTYNKLLCSIYETFGKAKFTNNNEVTRDTYYNLFREFWKQSPDNFKTFVISNGDLTNYFVSCNEYDTIEFILNTTPAEDRFNFIASDVNNSNQFGIFLAVFLKGDVKYAQWLIECCNLSEPDRKQRLKDELYFLSFTCVYQIFCHLEMFYELAQFCLESESDLKEFKRSLVNVQGNHICKMLLTRKEWTQADEFLAWCLPTRAEIIEFKNKFAFFST